MRRNFIEATVSGLLEAVEQSLLAEELARAPGLLQGIDARVNVIGLGALILASATSRSFAVLGALFAGTVTLAVLSRVPLRLIAKREWLPVLFFTGMIALPALFLTPGEVVYHLPLLHWPITATGVRSAMYLIARVETAATLALLLVLCTPWTRVLKALRALRVPVVIVMMLGMTLRYVFLLLQSAHEMFEARRSRIVGTLDGASRRRLATASAGVLLGKSLHLSGEVYGAMQSRGFRGEVYSLEDAPLRSRDWAALAAFLLLAIGCFWLGR